MCWTRQLGFGDQSAVIWFGKMEEVLSNINDYTCFYSSIFYLFSGWRQRKPATERSVSPSFKGTQDWEFFWLRFWNLPYFFVSYVKILGFYNKKNLIGPLLGEVRFFRVVLGLRGMEKHFELGQQIFFFSSIMDPKYDPILVFWKFNLLNASGTTLCVNLGSKCQIFIPLSLRLSGIKFSLVSD